MNAENKNHLSLIIWIVALIAIGGVIGSLTKPEINSWYSTLNRSALTPPNYVFPIAWTILYGIIGACGWLIWHLQAFPKLSVIKTLYVTQLILNWSWTPLFFGFHLTGLSLVVLVAICLVPHSYGITYKELKETHLWDVYCMAMPRQRHESEKKYKTLWRAPQK